MRGNLYTDHPLLEEEYGKIAPIREVKPVSYDGGKYVHVMWQGDEYEIKACYLYRKPGRLDEVKSIGSRFLKRLPFTEYD